MEGQIGEGLGQETGAANETQDEPVRLPNRAHGRMAGFGLALVLVLLSGFGEWAALTTGREALRLETSSGLANDYERARYAVASEESLERKYRLEPGPDIRTLFDQASASLQAALAAVRREGTASDRATVDRVLSLHARYLAAIGQMFDAVDAGDAARVLAIDHASVDPAFSTIQAVVDTEATQHRNDTFARLQSLDRSSTFILIATPIAFAIGVVLLVLFFLLLVGYRRRIEEARNRESARAAREKQRLLEGTVRSVEEERIRISAELHDGPIQHLTALDYRLEVFSNQLRNGRKEQGAEPLRQAQEWLRQDISQLRNMIAELRLPVVDQRGLAIALRSYADALTRDSELDCTIDCRIDGSLDPTIETVLYRVIQEALRNIVNHAHARHAEVVLDRRNGAVLLEVSDDGDGFEPTNTQSFTDLGHFGLAGMRDRVGLAGGDFDIESGRSGTRIKISLPYRGAAR